MEPNDSTMRFTRPGTGIRRLAVAAALLACTWTATAFGASSLHTDCDHRAAKDFLSPSAPKDELSVSVVDLTDDDSAIGLERSIDEGADAEGSIAPLLYLAPRVESILDDVFHEGSDKTDSAAAAQKTSLAPMADMGDIGDNVDEPTVPQSPEVENALEVQPALMRIQREMYRTDI